MIDSVSVALASFSDPSLRDADGVAPGTFHGLLSLAPDPGDGDGRGPVSASHTPVLAGRRVLEFGDVVWFERIHVEPHSFDAGFVVSPIEVTMRAWNSSRYQAVIAVEYGFEGDPGVNLVGPPDPPQHFPVFFQQEYTVFVDDTGPPQFESRLIWRFTDVFGTAFADEETDALYVGIRVVPWAIDPSGDVEEGYGYLTRVIASGADSEQRYGLRRIPVRSWAFDFVMPRSDSRLAQSLIHGWQHRPFGLPIWYDETRLDSEAAAGTTSLAADTTERIWGDLAILWISPLIWEVVQVTGVTDNEVTLGAVLNATWPAGSKLYPVHLARLEDQQSLEWRGQEMALGRVRFRGEDWSAA